MRLLAPPSRLLLAALAVLNAAPALADDTPDKTVSSTTSVITPCVATSTSGAFYDLRPDIAVAVRQGEKPPVRGVNSEDYLARGYDLGYNITLNICSAIAKKVDDFVGIDEALWRNVSAYYERNGKVYSLG